VPLTLVCCKRLLWPAYRCTVPTPPASPTTAQQGFDPAFGSVAAARRFLAAQLEKWNQQALLWAAQLVVSELATNSVLHARTAFTVAVRLLPEGALRLEVGDAVRRAPRQRHYELDATTGRGVALVADLARSWGVEQHADGKVVWCELAPPLEAAGGLSAGGSAEADADPGLLDLDAFLGPDDRSELAGGLRDGTR